MQASNASGVLLVFLIGAAAGASAAEPRNNAFTAYAAYRDGGDFTDVTTGNTVPIEAYGAWAVSLDWGIDAGSQLQLFVSRQSSQVDARQATQPAPPAAPLPAKFPIAVTYLHLGGTVSLDKKIGQGAYVSGGIGATLFEPDLAGLANELRASGSLALGYQLPLGERLALRFEARGYVTLINSDSALFCSGGCVISIKGDILTQGEVMLGVSFRY
jgi:hypothetical protein